MEIEMEIMSGNTERQNRDRSNFNERREIKWRPSLGNKDKVILDLCGGTGAWSKPYKDNGYTVYNATLPEIDITNIKISDKHIRFFYNKTAELIKIKDIYGILAAPPCTQFSFARTTARIPRDLHRGMQVVKTCLKIIWQCQYNIRSEYQKKPPLRFWALENPFAMLNWFLGKPAFVFNPWEFGDGYSKKTCLWGHFNNPSKQISFRFVRTKFDYINCGDLRKIHKTDKTERRGLRSITPAGFARAFYESNK